MSQHEDDVLEGGRPPYRKPPRGVLVALAVVCGAAALVWAVVVVVGSDGRAVALPTPTPTLTATPTSRTGFPDELPPIKAVVSPEVPPGDGFVGSNGRSLTVGGVSFSFSAPTEPEGFGWAIYGRPYISKSTVGGQTAEAVIYWTGFPDGGWAERCPPLLGSPVGPSDADLADAVATVAGTELVTGPRQVTVDGRAALHVVLTIREADVGCYRGFFHTWQYVKGGPFWTASRVGDTIRVWIVDMEGTRLFIAGLTHDDAGPELDEQIHTIVDSIRFT